MAPAHGGLGELAEAPAVIGQARAGGATTIIGLQRRIGNRAVAAAVAQRDKATADEGDEELSPLRQKLFDLFEEYNKTHVGQPIYDKIITKAGWDQKKSDEAAAQLKRNAYLAKYEAWKKDKSLEKPEFVAPVAIWTSCIGTQLTLLGEAITRAKVKAKGQTAFAAAGEKAATSIGPDVWHDASAGMTDRPKPGDIFVLAFRGEKVDKAQKAVDYIRLAKHGTLGKMYSDDRAKASLAAAQAAHDKAIAALADLDDDPTPDANAVKRAKAKLERAVTALTEAKDKAASTAAAVAESRAQAESDPALAKAEGALDKARGEVNRSLFQFSHVGFVKKIEKLPDGKERWTTFDGGQTVQTKEGSKHGSQEVTRIYDPAINEMTGEALQGNMPRWLEGWVDVDKVVKT